MADDASDLVGKVPKRMGRPPMPFDPEVAATICERIAMGMSLRAIHREDDSLPSMFTTLKWLAEYPDFARQYARAREAQADALVDEMLDIADDKTLDAQDRRVRLDTRKWLAGKMRPKKYGEKVLIGEDADNPLSKPAVEIDVFKLVDQMREAKRLLAAQSEPIMLEGKKAP